MSIVAIRGIVIGESQKGESNKQLLVLAKGLGKIWVSARGAKNTKSKLLAGTQLFSYCDFLAFEGRGFYSLTQAELIESFYEIRVDMERLAEAVYLAELLERTCPSGMEQDETLRLFLMTLTVLARGDMSPRLISRIFELKHLQIAGLLGEEECAVCGEGEQPLFFDPREGAFVCVRHKTGGCVPLGAAVQQAIGFVTAQEGRRIFSFSLSLEALTQLDDILERYLEVHMGVQLKSRKFSSGL